MPQVKVTLQVEVDGVALFGTAPLVRRYETEVVEPFDYVKADDGNATTFTTLPATVIAAVGALVVRPSRAVTLRLNGQTTAGIPLAADGLLLILDSTGIAGATINNDSDASARVRGVATGTAA